MALITDEYDNLVEVTIPVSKAELDKIFSLAVKIDQIQLHYNSDQLKMANEAISLMRGYASDIAARISLLR